jgi:hypothetical protein
VNRIRQSGELYLLEKGKWQQPEEAVWQFDCRVTDGITQTMRKASILTGHEEAPAAVR